MEPEPRTPWSPERLVGALPLVAGACWSVSILLTDLGQTALTGLLGFTDDAGIGVLSRALVWAVVVLILLTGAVTARETGDWQAGGRDGAACGLVVGVCVLATLLAMRAVFGNWLSGPGEHLSFSVEDGFRSGVWHVVFGVLGGAVLGAAGGIVALALPLRQTL
jgi:hypothetical protein